MAKGHKTGGGSRKGKPNKSTQDVQAFVDAVFKKISPEVLADELLASDNEKVKAMVFLKLLEYRYGKPVQPVSGAGDNAPPLRVKIEYIGE